jgi:hypothetical protein
MEIIDESDSCALVTVAASFMEMLMWRQWIQPARLGKARRLRNDAPSASPLNDQETLLK